METKSPLPSVSVIVPCRNERAYVEELLDSLLRQKADCFRIEFLIADGMSTDGTRQVVEKFSRAHPEVRLIDNPGRIVSTGLNEGIRQATGEIIVRMDAHTNYAPDYVESCVRVLDETGADNVGGPWRAQGRTYLQRAIAVAFQSPFSSGGARSHAVGYEGEVDSVYLGCWRRSTLIKLGLFDEELVRNQDDELNLRLINAGGKVWQSTRIVSAYYPRASIWGLFRQYFQYGYWKVRVIRKHRRPASLRHLVPSLFILVLVGSLLAGVVSEPARWAFLGVAALYAFFNVVATFSTLTNWQRVAYFPVMPLVFLAFHWGYGTGFLLGLLDTTLKRQDRQALRELTR